MSDLSAWEVGQLRHAERLTEYSGPVFDSDGDHYPDLEAEDLEDAAFCWAAKKVPFRIDVEQAIERALEELQQDLEDAFIEPEDLVGTSELEEFCRAWCAKQDLRVYEADYTRVVVLDEAKFEALMREVGL